MKRQVAIVALSGAIALALAILAPSRPKVSPSSREPAPASTSAAKEVPPPSRAAAQEPAITAGDEFADPFV